MMGREQTQKFRPAPEDPNKPAIINPVLPVKQFPKPPRNNVFGIGGTVENPNPYKTQPQKDFQTFTQTITYDLFQGTSPFSGNIMASFASCVRSDDFVRTTDDESATLAMVDFRSPCRVATRVSWECSAVSRRASASAALRFAA